MFVCARTLGGKEPTASLSNVSSERWSIRLEAGPRVSGGGGERRRPQGVQSVWREEHEANADEEVSHQVHGRDGEDHPQLNGGDAAGHLEAELGPTSGRQLCRAHHHQW